MAVAPSFQKYPTFGEPYEKNKRKYIVIVYPDGHHREVRWYDTEPAATSSKASAPKKVRSTKDVLGFSKGYITIFKGDTYPVLEWFQESVARYHNFWGWYIVSEDEVPETIPAGITPVQLKWEDVAIVEEDCLKSETLVRQAVDALIYEPSNSVWQASIGERIDRLLTVKKAVMNDDGYYGPSTFYLMLDEAGNEYCWTTAAKQLEVGETYEIRGTVKALSKYKGTEQTILTRCKIN